MGFRFGWNPVLPRILAHRIGFFIPGGGEKGARGKERWERERKKKEKENKIHAITARFYGQETRT